MVQKKQEALKLRIPVRQGIEIGLACLAAVAVMGVMLSLRLVPSRYPSVAMLLWLAVGSPVLEEFAFRGLLQDELVRFLPHKKFPVSLGNLLTSLVFSLLHLLLYGSFWSLLVFFPSLVFGYFKDQYNSIKPSIGLHVLYNTMYFSLFGV